MFNLSVASYYYLVTGIMLYRNRPNIGMSAIFFRLYFSWTKFFDVIFQVSSSSVTYTYIHTYLCVYVGSL